MGELFEIGDTVQCSERKDAGTIVPTPEKYAGNLTYTLCVDFGEIESQDMYTADGRYFVGGEVTLTIIKKATQPWKD